MEPTESDKEFQDKFVEMVEMMGGLFKQAKSDELDHLNHELVHPSHRLAMLIDGENADPNLVDKMLEEAARYGTVTIRRVYGDWTNPQMSGWIETSKKHAFKTMHQINSTTRKNATDTFLVIDAMEILYSDKDIGFCIVASDSDYTGLIKHLREHSRFVMGIGKKDTPESTQNACAVFVSTDNLSDPTRLSENRQDPQKDAESTTAAADHDMDWTAMVRTSINMVPDREWVLLATVGNNIRKLDPSFDTRTFGAKDLHSLISTAPGLFELTRIGGHYSVKIKND